MERHPGMEVEDAAVAKAVPANAVEIMPVRAAGAPLAPTQRIGVPGFAITNGYILPRNVDRLLSQRERYRLYEENLTNVAIISTGVRYFLDLVSSAEWNFEPADDSAKAQEVADFVQDAMHDMETSFFRIIRRQARYKFDGFSIQEWTVKPREDGRIGFLDIEPRPAHTIERWDVGSNGVVKGVLQTNPNTGQEIYLPVSKLVYVTDDTLSDSPEGLGLFRQAIRGAAGIARFEDLEHWGFETDLQGIPIGRVPIAHMQELVDEGVLTQAQMQQARLAIDSMIANHIRGPASGITLDSATYKTTDERGAPSNQRLWDIELLKSGGTSHAQIDVAIKRKTQELARLLGVEHLLLGSDGAGSLALSQSSTKRLHGMVNSCLNELRDVSAKQMIRPLMVLNNIPKPLWPKPKPEEIAYRTVEEVTGALANLATAGVPLMPGDAAVDAVRDMVGLPRTDPKADIIAQIEAGLARMSDAAASLDEGAGGGENESPRQTGRAGRTAGGSRPGLGKGGGDPLSRSLGDLTAYLEDARA
jgi:hypothetical protein